MLRKVDRLLSLEEKHGTVLHALQREMQELRDRMTAYEAREQMLIVEARSAAREASAQAAQASLSELSRALGKVEAQIEALTAGTPSAAGGGRRTTKRLPTVRKEDGPASG